MYDSGGMGRKKTAWPDLPPRMTGRRLDSGKVLHYYQAAGKKIPLGADRAAALIEWAKIEAGNAGPKLFPEITQEYRKAVFQHLATSTKEHYETALSNLDVCFAQFTLEQIAPKHVKTYIRDRTKKGAAIFEKRVGSAFFNWARSEGRTNAPNPFHGVTFTQAEKRAYGIAKKRKVYVTDAMYDEALDRADATTQDTMDLALYAGQRPSDVLKVRRQDIEEGVLFEGRAVRVLWFVQQKTGTEMGVVIEGDLERVINRILSRPRPVSSMYLICDKRGQRIPYNTHNNHFRKARGEATWQFRHIRTKAATDSPDLKSAQNLLGHAAETTTIIYRASKGNIVAALKRANSEPI